jgi:hypothetical protein
MAAARKFMQSLGPPPVTDVHSWQPSSLNWVDDGMYQSTVVFRPDVRSDNSRCDAHVHGLVMLILFALIFRDMMSSS